MKRKLLLLIIAFSTTQWCVAQNVLQKRISLSVENKPLSAVIDELESRYQIPFAYSPNILTGKKVTVDFKNKKLSFALKKILSNTDIGFRNENGKIILFKKSKSPPVTNKKNTYTISGYVSNGKNGEKLIGANIYLPKKQLGTRTNEYGFFSLSLPQGVHSVRVSYVGFDKKKIDVSLNANKRIDIALGPNKHLKKVIIATHKNEPEQNKPIGKLSIPVQEMKSLPTVGGEEDIIRSLQLLPGVKAGTDGFAGMQVRGGSPDQNLILMDGVPVYNPSHLFGFLSIFNADAVNKVELRKGGVPAHLGGRLSSVLDVRVKEGNIKRNVIQGSISPISAKILAEGPIVKDKGSFMFTARRTFLDLFLNLWDTQNSDFGTFTNEKNYSFYDLNGKANYKLGNKDRLYFSIYRGNDNFQTSGRFESSQLPFEDVMENGTRWSNTISSLRWNHLFSDKTFGNFTIDYSNYQFGTNIHSQSISQVDSNQYSFDYLSRISDWSARANFTYFPNPKHEFRYGLHATHHNFSPGATTRITIQGNAPQEDTYEETTKAMEYVLYAQEAWQLRNNLKINAGLRASMYAVNDVKYYGLQPRLALRLGIHKNWSVKGAYTSMTQYLHLLTNSSAGLPTDLWVSPDEKIKPQRSQQMSVGIYYNKNKTWNVSVEAYYKKLKDLIAYQEGTSLLYTTPNLSDKVTFGNGQSRGIEFLVGKQKGRTTGWITYTLSKSDRTFADINNGNTFPYRYDQRHDAAVTIIHRWKKRWQVSASWVFATGTTANVPLLQYDVNSVIPQLIEPVSFNPTNEYYGGRNDYRLRDFHRLNLGISYSLPTRWGAHSFGLSVYNAYNRINSLYVSQQIALNEQGGIQRTYVESGFIPIIPALSYRFRIDPNEKK